MTTPLIMLIILTTPYILERLFSARAGRQPDGAAAGAFGLGLLFLFAGSGHFFQTAPMAQMLPAWVPERTLLVYLTGLLELAIAAGLFIPRLRHLAGIGAFAALVLFFPANVYAALNHVPFGGHAWGPSYLLVRAPLQLVLVLWTWWFILRRPPAMPAPC